MGDGRDGCPHRSNARGLRPLPLTLSLFFEILFEAFFSLFHPRFVFVYVCFDRLETTGGRTGQSPFLLNNRFLWCTLAIRDIRTTSQEQTCPCRHVSVLCRDFRRQMCRYTAGNLQTRAGYSPQDMHKSCGPAQALSVACTA